MKVLCIGDVVGTQGVEYISKNLPKIKKENNIDVCIVNGENSDKSGTGITNHSAKAILDFGADVITTGNHCFRRASEDFFAEQPFVLCPANHPAVQLQDGVCCLDFGKITVDVFNLSGVAFLEPMQNPFKTLDILLKQSTAKIKILDFHAESTAEKQALAHYVDGRISAIFGTHTHVPTADACILPKGTGFITDVGMTGPKFSVIGTKPELAIRKQMYQLPVRFEISDNECSINAVVFEFDNNTYKCIDVKQLIV